MDSQEATRSFKQADALYAQHRYQEALSILEVLDANYPHAKNIMYPKALCLAALGRKDEALVVVDALEDLQDPRATALRAQLTAQPAEDDLGMEANLLDDFDRPAPKRAPVVIEATNRTPLYIGIAAAAVLLIGALAFTGVFSKMAGMFKKETPEEAIAKMVEVTSKMTGCTGVFQAEGKITKPMPTKITASGDFDFLLKDSTPLYRINAAVTAEAMAGMTQTILVVSDGATAFMEMNIMGQTMVMKLPPNGASNNLNPSAILTSLKSAGEVTLAKEEILDNLPAYVFIIKPAPDAQAPAGMPKVSEIRMVVPKTTGIPARIEVKDEAGVPVFNATLKDIVPSSSSTPEKFKYTPPPNVPVIDPANMKGGAMPFPIPGM